jgi:hypothetical protein
MATIKVVAVKAGFLKSQGRLVPTGTVLDISDEKLVRDAKEPNKLALNKDGTLVKHKWLRPVSSEGEGRKIAKDAKDAEEKKNRDAAVAASGGTAAKQKMENLKEAVNLAG